MNRRQFVAVLPMVAYGVTRRNSLPDAPRPALIIENDMVRTPNDGTQQWEEFMPTGQHLYWIGEQRVTLAEFDRARRELPAEYRAKWDWDAYMASRTEDGWPANMTPLIDGGWTKR